MHFFFFINTFIAKYTKYSLCIINPSSPPTYSRLFSSVSADAALLCIILFNTFSTDKTYEPTPFLPTFNCVPLLFFSACYSQGRNFDFLQQLLFFLIRNSIFHDGLELIIWTFEVPSDWFSRNIVWSIHLLLDKNRI